MKMGNHGGARGRGQKIDLALLACAVVAISFLPHGVAADRDDTGSQARLSAEVEGAEVRLRWTSPGPAIGESDVLVLRRLGEAPKGPQDDEAVVVYRGSDEGAADPLVDLFPDKQYVYAAYVCKRDGACDPNGVTASVEPTLTEALRGGGYVVYWRHASAESPSDDRTDLGAAEDAKVPGWWRKCEVEYAKQLTQFGIAQATEIGEQLRRRRIPFGRVLSSEFCRAVQTAELMNLGPKIEPLKELTMFVYRDDAQRCEDIYTLLREQPAPGTNTALISHMLHPSCPIIYKPPQAGAVIFKPDGVGETQFIRRVEAQQWKALGE